MSQKAPSLIHWADITADRIIKILGEKEKYVVASGITPSGVVHFGNFREVITVDLVARALRNRGKEVRFIFSWDDYDTFRKIPKNMPNQDRLKGFMFQPIVDTPDPNGEHASYAACHEHNFEKQLKKLGIAVEPLYQATKYRAKEYAENILQALEKREAIRHILNQHRQEPYGEDYLPVSVYCQKCNTDHQIEDKKWKSGELFYHCKNCGHQGQENPKHSTQLKLPWRIDWPMRWAYEKVDFEPGGKDHSSQGGSYTTAKEIVKEFGWRAPVYLQYDFVAIKGGGGKMSSSSGDVVTVDDVLKVYEPEMIRWIFASYKTNIDFSVSFDLDVIKTYEDFDRQERLAYGVEEGNAKKVAMAKRVFELAQLSPIEPGALNEKEIPIQPSFRHLTNILQINDGNIEAARKYYQEKLRTQRDERRFLERSQCALFWLKTYAPEDFKFSLNSEAPKVERDKQQNNFLSKLKNSLECEWKQFQSDKDLHEKMYEFIHEEELKPNLVFPLLYQILISKEKGPKLAGFIRTIGQERVLSLLNSALEK